jgi:Toprim domain
MGSAADLARRLRDEVEAVCRIYLPEGRRCGRYWIVGNVEGAPGRSMFVKLWGDRAGRWADSATGQHGDLLDLIRLNKGLRHFREALDEARFFLREPLFGNRGHAAPVQPLPVRDTRSAAARLYAISRPVPGTFAETYLRNRGVTASLDWPSLRFHPACYYRADDGAPLERWPALLGAVTDLGGAITGLQRTWLAGDGGGKAPVDDPRRAMGHLLGHAVRFGKPDGVMAAGEGIETVLSLLSLFPALPMAAGLSAAHLAAILFPASLRRLYVLRDNDAAGAFAEERLATRCRNAGIDCRALKPAAKDLNLDLRLEPAEAVKGRVIAQMVAEDRVRFLS